MEAKVTYALGLNNFAGEAFIFKTDRRMNKRDFLKTTAVLGSAAIFGPAVSALGKNSKQNPLISTLNSDGEYTLPPLTYDYNALEPYIDEATMRLHHDKHHAGYVKGLNTATAKVKEAIDSNDFSLIKHWERELAFHGAGHFLHNIFWKNMGPKQGQMSATLKKYINKSFGSEDNFRKLFFNATKSVEGSGWGIVAYQPDADKLVVLQAEKHHNQSQWVSVPILVCDVWEHAYYLKYQNMRGDYINGFMEVVNWDNVSELLESYL